MNRVSGDRNIAVDGAKMRQQRSETYETIQIRYVPQEGCLAGPRKRPAHGVRDNRSPMQAPVRARSIGEDSPPDFAPVRAQQKLYRFLSSWVT